MRVKAAGGLVLICVAALLVEACSHSGGSALPKLPNVQASPRIGSPRHPMSGSGPSVVATASNPTGSSGSTTTLSLSNGACANGDIVVVAIGYNSSSATSFSFSSGTWTSIRGPIANSSTDYAAYATYWHLCGASEPTSYTITASGSPLSGNNFNFVAAEISGASPTNPINQNPSLVYSSSTTSLSGTLTGCSVASNCLPIAIGFNAYDHSAPACSTGASTSEVTSNDGSGPGMALCGGSLTTNENSLSITMTQSPSDFMALDMLMIAPPAGPTVVAGAANPTGSNGSTTTLSFSNGACPSNDIIVIAIGYNSSSATGFSFSSGTWNSIRGPIANASTDYDAYATYWHLCGSSEPASYTITASGSPLSGNNFNFVAIEVTGASTTTPINQNPSIAYSSSATSVSGTLTGCTVSSNCLPVAVGFNGYDRSAPACSSGAGTSEATSNDGSGPGMKFCAGSLTANSNSISISMTQSSSDFFGLDMLMIAPPGGSPTPTPSPVASHIPTAIYYQAVVGGYDSPSGGVATALPFVTYWMPSGSTAQTVNSNGVSTSHILSYVDNSNVHDASGNCGGDYEASAVAGDSSTWAVNSGSSAVTGTYTEPAPCPTSTIFLTDPWKSDTQTIYNNGSQAAYNNDSGYAGVIFQDDVDSYEYNFSNGPPVHTCNGSSQSWYNCEPATAQQYATVIGAIPLSGVTHLLNAVAPLMYVYGSQPSISQFETEITDLVSPSNILGLECESCFASNQSNDSYNYAIGNANNGEANNQWTYTEDAIITLRNLSKVAWIQSQNTSATGTNSYNGRIYSFASIMLVWDPAYTVYENAWYGYSSTTQIHVFPEELITAYNPLVGYPSTTAGIGALQDSGGAYFREYSNCYNAGSSIGACAFVVNPSSSSVSAPHLSGTYGHTMVLNSQSDVLSGGTVSLTGAAVPSTIPGNTAYVLVP